MVFETKRKIYKKHKKGVTVYSNTKKPKYIKTISYNNYNSIVKQTETVRAIKKEKIYVKHQDKELYFEPKSELNIKVKYKLKIVPRVKEQIWFSHTFKCKCKASYPEKPFTHKHTGKILSPKDSVIEHYFTHIDTEKKYNYNDVIDNHNLHYPNHELLTINYRYSQLPLGDYL